MQRPFQRSTSTDQFFFLREQWFDTETVLTPRNRKQTKICLFKPLKPLFVSCIDLCTRTNSDTIGYQISLPSLVSSKLKISVRLYLSPSHLQSLGAQLWYLGDGQKWNQTALENLMKRPSNRFSLFWGQGPDLVSNFERMMESNFFHLQSMCKA